MHRFNMLNLMTMNMDNVEIEPFEINTVNISYTYKTIDYLLNKYNPSELTMVIGKDHFLSQKIGNGVRSHFNEICTFILWHYIRGSVYDTPFWKEAQTKTTAIFEQPNKKFQNIVNLAKSIDYIDIRDSSTSYGQWAPESIKLWYDEYII